MINKRFRAYAGSVVLVNLVVILWGAVVRATGSGAGCGSHWPLCNGEVIPRAPALETLIEFSHRLTSGAALLMVVGLVVWAWRAYGKGHPVRLGAGLSLLFMITEALVGAGLVLLELVADNQSVARAGWMAAHLLNTFLLLAALTLTAWWASGGQRVRLRGQGLAGALLGVGLLGTLVLGMSGAITALGDTLFPASSLAHGIAQDLSPTAHFLVRLRVLHPLIAVGVGFYLVFVASWVRAARPNVATWNFGQAVIVIFLVQLVAGVANVWLLAPVWMQLTHLLLADLLWMSLVLLTAAALATVPAPATASKPASFHPA